jgi:hypothetical protein
MFTTLAVAQTVCGPVSKKKHAKITCVTATVVGVLPAPLTEKEKEREAELAKNHCPPNSDSSSLIGASEHCVYLLMGHPDHTNADALSGDQLVYNHNGAYDTYVYIGKNGLVENVQTSY